MLVMMSLFLLALQFQVNTTDGWTATPGNKVPVVCYTVQSGDTLSEIAEMFQVSLNKLIEINNLTDSAMHSVRQIHPNQVLVIPDNLDATVLSRSSQIRDDVLLLARAIHAEARGESFTGKVAVGAVILNRVTSNQFPNTIEEVIMQNNRHTFQFSPVADGSINLAPDQPSIEAAYEALQGNDPTGGALFFYNPEISSDRWITTLPVATKIGNHVFCN